MTVTVDVHLRPGGTVAALREEARAGLTATPKVLAPKWFYDENGSALFEAITRLPEYYLTRAEAAILAERSPAIARLSGADTLVELGSGTSEKTRLLLDAMQAAGTLRRFVPLDVSEATLRAAGSALDAEYPGLDVHGVVADFEQHLGALPAGGRRLVAFLGSTIGNLEPPERAKFLSTLAAVLAPGEWLLLGTDLVKDRARLEAAYDDSAGVTARFNKNVLAVLNRELHAGFDVDRFAHVARFDEEHEWVEMRLRSEQAHVVPVVALQLVVPFAAGEEMRTEVSAKFRREGVEDELGAAGFEVARWWTDPAGDFALSLSSRA